MYNANNDDWENEFNIEESSYLFIILISFGKMLDYNKILYVFQKHNKKKKINNKILKTRLPLIKNLVMIFGPNNLQLISKIHNKIMSLEILELLLLGNKNKLKKSIF